MQTPIESMLDSVEWMPVERTGEIAKNDLPYATHSGVLAICGHELRCYRLNTGHAVFDADDVKKFFSGVLR